MTLQVWIGSKWDRALGGEPFGEMERFTYLGSCISDEGSSPTRKAELALADLKYLWCQLILGY